MRCPKLTVARDSVTYTLQNVALCENRPNMKAAIQVKSLACGVLLLCGTASSFSLTLGRAQGAIFVGRALDMRVQLQFDANEEIQPGCMEADVFYGDQQVDPARVSVHLEPASTAGSKGAVARVESSVLIDEPIVSVNLRAGCQQRSSRRYTLFPDVATNVVEAPVQAKVAPIPMALPVVPAAVANVVTAPVQSAQASTPARARRKTKADANTEAGPAVAKAQRAASPAKLPAPMVAAPVARGGKPNGRSRLKLDPLDLQIERDPVLRSSSEMSTLPQDNAENRAAAAALWKSLNASPEELMREDAKAMAIARDLKALYTVTAENQKNLMELAGKVQQAESERYANGLVYTLAVLLLLCLSAFAWTVLRLRANRQPNWADGMDAPDSLLAELAQADSIDRYAQAPVREPTLARAVAQSAVPPAAAPEKPPAVRTKPTPTYATASDTDTAPQSANLTEVDFDLDLMMPPSFVSQPPASLIAPVASTALQAPIAPSSPPQAPSLVAPARDFSLSVAAGLRAIDSEELVDVRQQADFFVSLGEHQKAIDILTTRVAQCGESSPLVCLELLKLYHALGRESEFEFMRTEFNSWFTGRVPPFSSFGDEGHPLEHYVEVVRQIEALWPGPKVLEYIENCIYHHSTDAQWPYFDLHAYRDLLLLHAIAKRIIRLPSDAGDSHGAELIRIPAPATPVLSLGIASDITDGSNTVVHRAGPQHRGGWKRKPTKTRRPVEPDVDPQADVETRGAPLGAMKVPPTEPQSEPGSADEDANRDHGPTTDFNFLNLR